MPLLVVLLPLSRCVISEEWGEWPTPGGREGGREGRRGEGLVVVVEENRSCVGWVGEGRREGGREGGRARHTFFLVDQLVLHLLQFVAGARAFHPPGFD